MNEPASALPAGLSVQVVNRLEVRCEDQQCRLLVASDGACNFVAEAPTRAGMIDLAAEHVALWHPGPDLCVTGDCTDLAVEPGSRHLVAGPNWPRACAEHSRIRYRNDRFEDRLFCRTSDCRGEAEVSVMFSHGIDTLCVRCASYTPEGSRMLLQRGIPAPAVDESLVEGRP